MYIRKASRTYKGKIYSHYLLVESVVTPKGPRQKIICSLGDLSPRSREEWLALAHKLESALSGQQYLPGTSPDTELSGILEKVRSSAPVLPIPPPVATTGERPRRTLSAAEVPK